MSKIPNPFEFDDNLEVLIEQDNLYRMAKNSSKQNFKKNHNIETNFGQSLNQAYLKFVYSLTHNAVVATIIILIAMTTVAATAAQIIAPDGYKPSDFLFPEPTSIEEQSNSGASSSNLPQTSDLGSLALDLAQDRPLMADDNYEVLVLEECDLAIKYNKTLELHKKINRTRNYIEIANLPFFNLSCGDLSNWPAWESNQDFKEVDLNLAESPKILSSLSSKYLKENGGFYEQSSGDNSITEQESVFQIKGPKAIYTFSTPVRDLDTLDIVIQFDSLNPSISSITEEANNSENLILALNGDCVSGFGEELNSALLDCQLIDFNQEKTIALIPVKRSCGGACLGDNIILGKKVENIQYVYNTLYSSGEKDIRTLIIYEVDLDSGKVKQVQEVVAEFCNVPFEDPLTSEQLNQLSLFTNTLNEYSGGGLTVEDLVCNSPNNNEINPNSNPKGSKIEEYKNEFYTDLVVRYDQSWKFSTTTNPSYVPGLLNRNISLSKEDITINFDIRPQGLECGFGILPVEALITNSLNEKISSHLLINNKTFRQTIVYGSEPFCKLVSTNTNIKVSDISGKDTYKAIFPEDEFVRYVVDISIIDINDEYLETDEFFDQKNNLSQKHPLRPEIEEILKNSKF